MKSKKRPPRLPPAVAVIDTNVFLDIHSCHDIKRDFDALYAKIGRAAIDDPAITYRIACARESLLLAMHLDAAGATTISLKHETLKMLLQFAPPIGAGGTSFEADFTGTFTWFVKDYCLRRWMPGFTSHFGPVVKTEADRAHVTLAQREKLPLISNEGYSVTGEIDDSKPLRRFARAASVDVLLPRQFYAGKIDETKAIDTFLDRFYKRAPVYLTKRAIPDQKGELLDLIYGMYRLVLRGEVADRDERAHVQLGGADGGSSGRVSP